MAAVALTRTARDAYCNYSFDHNNYKFRAVARGGRTVLTLRAQILRGRENEKFKFYAKYNKS